MHDKRGDHDAVSLSMRLTRRVPLLSPVLSSPMDTVNEGAMAAAMASLGVLSIIHSNLSAADQASVVRSVKSRHVPILSAPTFRAPSCIHSLDDFDSCPYVLVTQSGSTSSQLLGYASKSDWLKGREESGRPFREKLKGKIIFFMPAKKCKQ
jgi:IMP dehydrogenase